MDKYMWKKKMFGDGIQLVTVAQVLVMGVLKAVYICHIC
jgi:hypothetical protein